MSFRVQSRDEIPAASYYVIAEDRFLHDIIVLPCDTLDKAKTVFDNIRAYRQEMRRPHISASKPQVSKALPLTVMPEADAPSWYQPRMGERYPVRA